MSFADELRNAPEERKKEEERQRQLALEREKRDWQALITEWYKYLKTACKKCASGNQTSYTGTFEDFIKEADRASGSSERLPDWLDRVNSRIRYQLNPSYPDRIQVCLSEEDVADIEATIQERLEADGVLVEFTRKEYQKYRLERVFVERSEGERVAASILNTLFPLNTIGLKER